MQNSFFDAQEMAIFARVVNDACLKLGCDDTQRDMIAARVMSFAANGTRDYETLFAIATYRRDGVA